jgi:4-amino-4-deoxy-L-arabinose transferase-like glycosyltransferase
MPTKFPRWLDLNVVATVLISKFLILIFASQAYLVVSDKPFSGGETFLSIWDRWDASQYLKIAQNGYAAVGDDRFLIVFFPLYPLLVAAGRILTGDYLVSAFLISAIASLAAGLLLRKLALLDHGEKTAHLAVIFLFIFPTSYFLHIPYTESLFLTAVIGSFLAARNRMWLVAGVLGGLACLTRINGLILLPALAFEVWDEYRGGRQLNYRWLFLLLIPLGFGCYLFLNYWVSGDPLIFMQYQREHWYRYFRWPWEGVWEAVKRIDNPKAVDAQMIGIQEVLFVVIGAFATIVGWRHIRNSYRVWMVANWLLFVSTSFVLSVPRYTLSLFPLFILMSLAARKYRYAGFAMCFWSVLYLALFVTQFVRGMWAF